MSIGYERKWSIIQTPDILKQRQMCSSVKFPGHLLHQKLNQHLRKERVSWKIFSYYLFSKCKPLKTQCCS